MAVTLPYLQARSVGGALMVLGHLIFALHFVLLVTNFGPQRDKPALFRQLFGRKATP